MASYHDRGFQDMNRVGKKKAQRRVHRSSLDEAEYTLHAIEQSLRPGYEAFSREFLRPSDNSRSGQSSRDQRDQYNIMTKVLKPERRREKVKDWLSGNDLPYSAHTGRSASSQRFTTNFLNSKGYFEGDEIFKTSDDIRFDYPDVVMFDVEPFEVAPEVQTAGYYHEEQQEDDVVPEFKDLNLNKTKGRSAKATDASELKQPRRAKKYYHT